MILVCLSTFPELEVARRISGVLVEEGLVACVNLLPAVESIYTWQGKREAGVEVLAVLKTTQAGYAALEKRLLELHPYEVPELIALPAVQAAAGYAAWVTEHSGGAGGSGVRGLTAGWDAVFGGYVHLSVSLEILCITGAQTIPLGLLPSCPFRHKKAHLEDFRVRSMN